MKISGMSAVVTGAGSGLGAATARALAREGAMVALLDTNLDAAKSVAEEIGGFAAYCDVSDPAVAGKALASAAEHNGVPRILVNCAGITIGRVPLTGGDATARFTAFEKVLRVNLNGTLIMLSLFADQMMGLDPLANGERGLVIMTASVAAYDGQIGMSGYSASKGGVVALTLPAARELAANGIRVNTIAPGYFETPILDGVPEYVREGVASGFVFPRRFGTGEEYARLAAHIIENEMLNGETIRLDGGMRLPPSFNTGGANGC
ncbi:MAG: SDR family NAD(P)-dependent oxidoreductase [Desulfuromonadaceae bacterium]